MKKYFFSGLFIVAFVIYAFGQARSKTHTLVPIQSPTSAYTASSPSATTASTGASGSPPAGSGSSGSSTAGQYKSGTYTGSVADAYYGNVQVQAVVANGKLTDVQFLQYPSDARHSAELSAQAMPILKSEAIAAQSANVDLLSGATDTSQAFRQSLQSALAQAK